MLIYLVYIMTAALLGTGLYYRLQAARSGEPLDRRGEGWPLLVAIRLCGIAFVAVILTAEAPLEGPLSWAGAIAFTGAAGWLIWMYRSLGRNITDTVAVRRDATLVSHGPYRLVRHPMYTGLLAAGVSLAVVLRSWALLAVTIVTFTLLALRSGAEERFLAERFGQAYLQYMQRTARFFPKFI